MRRGERMPAMDYFNRVLALDDGNVRVMQAVRRIGRKRAMRRVFVMAASAGLALGVGVFALELLIPPRAKQLSLSVAPPTQRSVAPKAAGTKIASPGDARVVTTPPKTSNGSVDTPRRNGTHAHAVVASTEPREVVFAPTPANVSISVDGQDARAYGPSFHKVELAPGDHNFRFIGAHDCCVDDEVTVKIPAGPGSTTVAHKLTFRPSGLYVESNVPANVAVDGGAIAGRTRSLIRVPHEADLVEVHRIRVSADGYREITIEVRTRAGQVSTVQAQLEPSSASPKITG
jgi:hypothetical protein